jgi:hypothetical protein
MSVYSGAYLLSPKISAMIRHAVKNALKFCPKNVYWRKQRVSSKRPNSTVVHLVINEQKGANDRFWATTKGDPILR